MSVPLDGGPPITIATGSDYPLGISVGDGTIVWASGQSSRVLSVPVDGGTTSTIASQQSWMSRPVVAGPKVYWLVGLPQPKFAGAGEAGCPGAPVAPPAGSVVRAPLPSGPSMAIVTGVRNPQYFAVDSTGVYFTTCDDNLVNGAILKATLQ